MYIVCMSVHACVCVGVSVYMLTSHNLCMYVRTCTSSTYSMYIRIHMYVCARCSQYDHHNINSCCNLQSNSLQNNPL